MDIALERSYPTPFANSTLLPLLLMSLASQRHSPDSSIKIKKEYDYVIVGAGSAGSVLASRLTELPCVTVLLLEAGRKPPILTDVPSLVRSFYFTDIDWQYRTTPQKYTGRVLVNRELPWTAGKAIGGSSVINAMFYVRGNRKDYEDWEAMGAKGWGYKDVFPYFLKLEDNRDSKFLANGYHAIGGPVTTEQPRYHPALQRAVYRAAIDQGYEILDSNGERQTGFYVHQSNLRNNQRCSTAKAYLVPAENRTNLDILSDAMVRKIIIHNKRATGVRFDVGGHTYEVRARREVIVSAGCVNTPQLLMLSGVGPKEELQRLNIPVKSDLPVGKNFHDHAAIPVVYEFNSYTSDFGVRLSNPYNIKQYIHNRTGPLAATAAINMIAFLKGEEIRSVTDSPSYELYFGELTTPVVRDQFGVIPEVYRRYFGPYENQPLFLCIVSEVQPRSRGTITLKSRNPYDPPVIDPNYFEDFRDVEDMVQGMKTCRKLAESKHLRELGIKPLKTLMPGCEKYADNEEDYYRCFIRSIITSIHHGVGTAKMGDSSDPTTVVDAHLRVKNIEGLRVVDASIMPKVTTGNTQIPTIMIAEKASDIIKETIHCYNEPLDHWGNSQRSSVRMKNPKADWNEETEILGLDGNYDNGDYWKNSPTKVSWIEEKKGKLWDEKDEYEKPLIYNEKEILLEDYLKHPQEYSWHKPGGKIENEYRKIPQISSRDVEGKHNSKHYTTDQSKIPYIKEQKSHVDDHWEGSLPTSWYKD